MKRTTPFQCFHNPAHDADAASDGTANISGYVCDASSSSERDAASENVLGTPSA